MKRQLESFHIFLIMSVVLAVGCATSKKSASGGPGLDQLQSMASQIDNAGFTEEVRIFSEGGSTGSVVLYTDGLRTRKASMTTSGTHSDQQEHYYFDVAGQLFRTVRLKLNRNCDQAGNICLTEKSSYFSNGQAIDVKERMVTASADQERRMTQMISGEKWQKLPIEAASYFTELENYRLLESHFQRAGTVREESPTPEAESATWIVWADGQALRMSGNPDASIVTTLAEAEVVQTTGNQSSTSYLEMIRGRRFTEVYVEVLTGTGQKGWIHRGALRAPEHYLVVANIASVRSEPTTRAQTLKELKEGDRIIFYGNKAGNPVTITLGGKEVTDNYYRIRTTDGIVGWVHGATIKIIE